MQQLYADLDVEDMVAFKSNRHVQQTNRRFVINLREKLKEAEDIVNLEILAAQVSAREVVNSPQESKSVHLHPYICTVLHCPASECLP